MTFEDYILEHFRAHMFQLTAARRRLEDRFFGWNGSWSFQLTAARRRLGTRVAAPVSDRGFNSQPPGGGWAAGLP